MSWLDHLHHTLLDMTTDNNLPDYVLAGVRGAQGVQGRGWSGARRGAALPGHAYGSRPPAHSSGPSPQG